MNKKKYPDIENIQSKITSEGVAHLIYHANDINDIVHVYSVKGYECLSGGFVEFMDRFRTVIPRKVPIILEIKGKHFDDEEKAAIDNAIWTQYGLYLSEVHNNLKSIRLKMALYFILMAISSVFLFWVASSTSEVIANYGYILFWFFGYRVMTHLILDYHPIHREYQWYRRLAAMKLLFSEDGMQELDTQDLLQEVSKYEKEADRQIREHLFVNNVLMDDVGVALGCKITRPDEVLCSSGVDDMEIVSDEMADYLISTLPFIKRKYVTRLEIEGAAFTEDERDRITKAIRNHLGFVISEQDSERITNRKICSLFSVGLFISTMVLYLWGQRMNLAIHEFVILSFWFFADYLLDFLFLTGTQIRAKKKTLEKLAEMEIIFKENSDSI